MRTPLSLSLLAAPVLLAQTAKPDTVKPGAVKPDAVKPDAAKPKVLTLGNPAPELKISRWVKGTAHASLEKGKVYVVEFWATWCGPCRESIPHLSELARQHKGKVTFIGVDVWEHPKQGEDIDKTVDAFVQEMGAKMDYDVARDTADAFMATAWMKAAERNGIPCAFVVDAQGRIAWIGHPMFGLDKVLESILAGRHDLAAAASEYEQEQTAARERQAKQTAVRAAMKEVAPTLEEARKANDHAKILAVVDQAIAKHAVLGDALAPLRFSALVHTDEAKADEMLAAEKAKPRPNLAGFAAIVVNEEGLAAAWYEKAKALLQTELAKPGGNLMLLEQLARVCHRLKQYPEAVAAQEKFVTFAKENKAPQDYLKRFEADLATYKAAK